MKVFSRQNSYMSWLHKFACNCMQSQKILGSAPVSLYSRHHKYIFLYFVELLLQNREENVILYVFILGVYYVNEVPGGYFLCMADFPGSYP